MLITKLNESNRIVGFRCGNFNETDIYDSEIEMDIRILSQANDLHDIMYAIYDSVNNTLIFDDEYTAFHEAQNAEVNEEQPT